MVVDAKKIAEKISKSPFIRDRRPHDSFLSGKNIYFVEPWKENYTLLEVRPSKKGGMIRHYTSKRPGGQCFIRGIVLDVK